MLLGRVRRALSLALLAAALVSVPAAATSGPGRKSHHSTPRAPHSRVHVRAYTKKDGTRVRPHTRSYPKTRGSTGKKH
jgi:hypothetical protein